MAKLLYTPGLRGPNAQVIHSNSQRGRGAVLQSHDITDEEARTLTIDELARKYPLVTAPVAEPVAEHEKKVMPAMETGETVPRERQLNLSQDRS